MNTTQTPTAPAFTVQEIHDGHSLGVWVDRGHGPYLVLTVATGKAAMYQEARDRNMAEALARAAEFIAGYGA